MHIVNIPSYLDAYVPYGGRLWHRENLATLKTDQKFAKFLSSKFLHIYSKVSRECNTATSS